MSRKIRPNRISLEIRASNLAVFCDAGCTRLELRKHLEAQFKDGMHWGNYGEWQIDHITPIAFFDFSRADDYFACSHFSNLQPLWRSQNLRKSSYIGGRRIRSRTANFGVLEDWNTWDYKAGFAFLTTPNKCLEFTNAQDLRRAISWGYQKGIKSITRKCSDGVFRLWKRFEPLVDTTDISDPILLDKFCCAGWSIDEICKI